MPKSSKQIVRQPLVVPRVSILAHTKNVPSIAEYISTRQLGLVVSSQENVVSIKT